MRVLIAGCGYLGIALGGRLARCGHQVHGLRRTPFTPGPISGASDIQPILGDLSRPETLSGLSEIPWDWVIQCAAPTEGSEPAYHRTYVLGARHLLDAVGRVPLRGFVFVGSTSVYGQTDGAEVDESSPTEPLDFAGRVMLEAEAAVVERSAVHGAPGWVLRAAGIYGPGRNRIQTARSGVKPPESDPSRRMNLIHRDDLAEAVVAVLEKTPASRIFNVCDGVHPTAGEFQKWLASRVGARDAAGAGEVRPARRTRPRTDKRVIADRLRLETGWQPAYPDYRAGYEALLNSEAPA